MSDGLQASQTDLVPAEPGADAVGQLLETIEAERQRKAAGTARTREPSDGPG